MSESISSQLKALTQQHAQLTAQLDGMQADYTKAKASAQATAAGHRASGDAAAAAMRAAFAAAAAAAAAAQPGTKGMAAGYAAQGRGFLMQAQGFNAQAAAAMSALDAPRAALSEARSSLRQLDTQIKTLKAQQRLMRHPQLRHIKFRGFDNARGISELMIREILSELPPRLTAEIGNIHYVHKFREDMALGLTSQHLRPGDKAHITLFDSFTFELEEREIEYKDTVIHEVGHVMFGWLMSLQQQLAWGMLYLDTLRSGEDFVTDYAALSKREDHAESFRIYQTNLSKLYAKHRERYDIIDELYKEIS